MSRFPVVVVLLSVLALVACGQAAPPPAPAPRTSATAPAVPRDRSAAGPYGVGVVTTQPHDPVGKKDLPLTIYHPVRDPALAPATSPAFPVIVLSHGAGGWPDTYAHLARHWASHGYLVLVLTHADSTSLPAATQPAPGGEAEPVRRGMAAALGDPAAWVQRAKDMTAALDALPELAKTAPAISGYDLKRVGAAGHSLGAHTALLAGGAKIETASPGSPLRGFRDQRFRAVLAMSGQGVGMLGQTPQTWAELNLPVMWIGGSQDWGQSGQPPRWRLQGYDLAPAGDKFRLFLAGGSHYTGSGRLTDELTPAEIRSIMGANADGSDKTYDRQAEQKLFGYVKLASVAFWDAYLKGDAEAKAWLVEGRLAGESGGVVEVRKR